MIATFKLVQSKRYPVFQTPVDVAFVNRPKEGESFIFAHPTQGMCHTSTVQSISVDSENGDLLLHTLNSIYHLQMHQEK